MKVKIRKLLEDNTSKEIEERLKGTFAQKSHSVQRLILEFLEERITGREYESKKEIEDALKTWKDFVKGKVEEGKLSYLPNDYKKLWVEGAGIAAAEGLGGPFMVATIEHKI